MPDYKLAARKAARKYKLNEGVFLAQINQESGFNPSSSSPAGARGIAQFIPSTAKNYGVNLGDGRVSDDLDGAARYMRDNLRTFGGDYRKALAAYNAGEGAVKKYGGIPPFAETQHYVKTIMANAGKYGGTTTTAGRTKPQRAETLLPARAARSTPEKVDIEGALVDSLLSRRKGESLFQATTRAVDSGSYTTPATSTPASPAVRLPGVAARRQPQTGGADIERVRAEADRIDAARVPYLWGGGHSKKQARGSKVTPLDCSGAVSRILGINPQVSGQFAQWGKPGRGKRMTIYANSEHVLVEIDGHFWGTSKSNPGGGAGWIPRSAVSSAYLARFTKRHPAGM